MQILNKKKIQTVRATESLKDDQPSLALQIVNRYFRWIVVLVLGSVFFAGYVLVLDERIAEVQNAARESLPQKLKVRDDLRSIKAELDEAVLDFDKIKISKNQALERIKLLLPEDSKYGDLFTLLDTITTLNGMRMTNITIALPDETKPQQRAKAAGASADTDPVSAGLVHTLTIRISVEGGTYDTFKTYLSSLERNVRLFDIQSLSFQGSSFIPNADGSLPTPRYDIELVTYYQS